MYSGGSKEAGNYPLLSRAMELGLYHPRCKDSHSTYFEGISTPPDDNFTEKDIEEIKDSYTDEQKRNVAQHNYQKYSRMAQHSLDKENQQKYAARAEYWKDEYSKYYKLLSNKTNLNAQGIEYMASSFRPEYGENKEVALGNIIFDVKHVVNSDFSVYADKDYTRRNMAVRFVEKSLSRIADSRGSGDIPTIVVVDFDKYNLKKAVIAGYDRATETVFYNAKYDTTAKVVAFINQTEGYFASKTADAPLLHEFGHHFYNLYVKNLAKSNGISYNESEYIVKKSIYRKIEDLGGEDYAIAISGYARKGYKQSELSEIIAELYSVGREGELL